MQRPKPKIVLILNFLSTLTPFCSQSTSQACRFCSNNILKPNSSYQSPLYLTHVDRNCVRETMFIWNNLLPGLPASFLFFFFFRDSASERGAECEREKQGSSQVGLLFSRKQGSCSPGAGLEPTNP